MDNLDLDKLMNSKVSGARKKKIATSVVTAILCAGLVTGGAFGVKYLNDAKKTTPTEQTEPGEKELPDEEKPAEETTPEETPTEETENEIEHSMQMIWFGDEGYSQFDRIAINVMHGEEVVHSFSLSAENDWKCSWSDEYNASDLTLTGLFPDGVTAEFSISGENFVISSTYTPVEGSSESENPTADPGDPDKKEEERPNGFGDKDGTAGSGSKNTVSDSELPQTGLRDWITIFLMGLGTVMVLFGIFEIKRPERLR